MQPDPGLTSAPRALGFDALSLPDDETMLAVTRSLAVFLGIG
jgi:hypothetical protein